ncbi:hypothetical protein [Streptomyces sp. NPDC051546]|uniref:hypothetical protein n=1 Tax=Streptomyces sp. NPDC051546 TaxID=3365655 RepID=UPI0037B753A5
MTELVVKMTADQLAQVFLVLRRSACGEAQAAAGMLVPFTEKPGQRVSVPYVTVNRAERALRGVLERETRDGYRVTLSQLTGYLAGVRPEEQCDRDLPVAGTVGHP